MSLSSIMAIPGRADGAAAAAGLWLQRSHIPHTQTVTGSVVNLLTAANWKGRSAALKRSWQR